MKYEGAKSRPAFTAKTRCVGWLEARATLYASLQTDPKLWDLSLISP